MDIFEKTYKQVMEKRQSKFRLIFWDSPCLQAFLFHSTGSAVLWADYCITAVWCGGGEPILTPLQTGVLSPGTRNYAGIPARLFLGLCTLVLGHIAWVVFSSADPYMAPTHLTLNTQILETIPATIILGFRGTPKLQDSFVA